jgi:hypothetical protein
MSTISQTIPSLGSPPLTTDPVNFDTRADTLYGTSLPAVITATNTWSGQANTVAGEVNTNATNAQTAANTATAASAAAIAAVNATEWVSGQAYVEGDVVWSLINYLSYRANTNTSGTTDPSLSGEWVLISGNVSTSGTQTLTNKTLTDPAIIGTILEDVYTIVDGAAFEIDPGNGSIQLITLGASRTPKATNFAAGEAITLMVDDGTDYTITWTDATWGGSGVIWSTDGGVAPTLNTTGFTSIVLWKVSTQVYGARVGDA